jgi:hypothetical protein
MTTTTEIGTAIARSISHNEIVKVEADDINAALDAINEDESVTELDSANTDTGLDVWGKHNGSDFRLYIVKA